MKKRFMLFFGMLLIAFAIMTNQKVYADSYYQHTEADYMIVPDKYNTGCEDVSNLIKFVPGTYDGITIWNSGTTDVKIDFRKYPNISGNVTFQGLDFSDKNFRIYNENALNDEITITFINCNFSVFRGNTTKTNAKYVFVNCSFNQCYGSNMVIDHCYFGGGAKDGLVPYTDVEVTSCYFADKSQQNTSVGAGTHTDGTQIYGSKDCITKNVHYDNCRFELPQLLNSSATVNACIMLQLEYADAENISFTNCRVNGGGYSIYARAVSGKNLSNVVLDNIRVGCAARWGTYCTCARTTSVHDDQITFGLICDENSLYVGSSWSDETGMHISVSNDTNENRMLYVKSDLGEQYFEIPACYKYKQLTDGISFNDFPFDIDINLGYATWAVCYDVTYGVENQIRFINNTGFEISIDGVYVSEEENNKKPSNESEDSYIEIELTENDEFANGVEFGDVIAEGECGTKDSKINWSLSTDGTLLIYGIGMMENYHSQKEAPWRQYRASIIRVVIMDGVTSVGSRAFNECENLIDVDMPDSILTIGDLAFRRCNQLKNIAFPSSLTSIGKYAFNYLKLDSVDYMGDVTKLYIGQNNGNIFELLNR